jgi:hypothetical protein
VTQRNNVMTLTRGEAVPGRGNGEDVSWTDVNFIGQKMKKNRMQSIQLVLCK